MIDEYCVTTISWYALSKDGNGDVVRNSTGDPTYAAVQSIKAKVEYKEKLLKSPNTGERKVSNTQIYYNSDYAIAVGDRITIDNVNYEVEFTGKFDMFDVSDHRKAYLI